MTDGALSWGSSEDFDALMIRARPVGAADDGNLSAILAAR